MEEKAPMSWKEIALQRRILSTISFGRDSMIHLYESSCNSGNSQNDSSCYVWFLVCSKRDTSNVLIFHSTKPTATVLHTSRITIAKLTQADTMQRTQLAQYCCQNPSQQFCKFPHSLTHPIPLIPHVLAYPDGVQKISDPVWWTYTASLSSLQVAALLPRTILLWRAASFRTVDDESKIIFTSLPD